MKELILLGSLISILLGTGVAYGQMGQQAPDSENMSTAVNMSQSSNMSNASSVSDLVSQRCMPELGQVCNASGTNTTELLPPDGFTSKGEARMPGGPPQ